MTEKQIQTYKQHLKDRLTIGGIPSHTREPILNYILHGIPGGSFLNAVLTNNLVEAVSRADHLNINALPAYVSFFYNYAPSTCWRSHENVESWTASGGLTKRNQETKEQ